MSPERWEEFYNRILDETEILNNHFGENPTLARTLRMADVTASAFGLQFCEGNRQHIQCFAAIAAVTRQLFSLAIVRPSALEEIYMDFKPEFQAMFSDGLVNFAYVECPEFPIPPEISNPGEPA